MEKTERNTARIEIKIPESMKLDVKTKLGNYNLSGKMRDVLRKEIDKADLHIERFQTCYFCGKDKIIPFEDLLQSGVCKEDDQNTHSMFLLACRSCVRFLMDKKQQDLTNEDRISLTLFKTKPHHFTEEYALLWARLMREHPLKYSINGALVNNYSNKEEFEEHMLSLNE